MKRNFFKAFDKRQDAVHPTHADVRKRMIKGSGWTRKDGPFPGCFRERKAQSLIWSCTWSTSQGLLKAEDWYPLNSITSGEMLAEAQEFQLRHPTDFRIAEELNPLLSAYHRDEINIRWFDRMLKVMKRLRGMNQEYCCTWDMPPSTGPGMLMNPIFRPGGWGPELKKPVMTGKSAARHRVGRAI